MLRIPSDNVNSGRKPSRQLESVPRLWSTHIWLRLVDLEQELCLAITMIKDASRVGFG